MSADAYEECGECGHYPAYCPPGGKKCSAWDPDQPNWKCACKGRKKKTVPVPIEQKPWGHERADLHGE